MAQKQLQKPSLKSVPPVSTAKGTLQDVAKRPANQPRPTRKPQQLTSIRPQQTLRPVQSSEKTDQVEPTKELTKEPTEETVKEPTKEPAQSFIKKLTKKQLAMIIGGIVIVVIIIVLACLLFGGGSNFHGDSEPDDIELSTDIDFDQKVTNADGEKFTSSYQQGSEEDFSVRFVDLQCNDDCENVTQVRLGNQILTKGEDYEVKTGSIIIVLKAKALDAQKSGDVKLVITVETDGEEKLYGVKITLKAIPTCSEGQTWKKDKCVSDDDKEDEDKDKEDEPNDSSTTDSSTSSKSQAQIDCENQSGPNQVIQLKWLSQDDLERMMPDGDYSDIRVGMSNFTLSNSAMHWVNGTCKPTSITTDIGVGYQPMTDSTLSSYPFYSSLRDGQNMVVWYWSDGSYEVEYVSDPAVIWSY